MRVPSIELLRPEVTKVIYDLQWSHFRPFQDEAIDAIVNTSNDIIISAPTASGKTEAAFLPAISTTCSELDKNIKIIYILPLKALINDQNNRIEKLCQYLDCKVTKWHGDASESKKRKLLSNPNGIMLITPESLESFLINRSTIVGDLFNSVAYYIIDEVHSFVGSPRGEQLKSILHRINVAASIKPRRVLLSATIGSLSNYKDWLDNDDPIAIEDKDGGKGMSGSIRFFMHTQSLGDNIEDQSNSYYNELIDVSSAGKKLIFGNSKNKLEQTCATLKSYRPNSSNTIEIHHGSLSKSQREYVEKSLKTKPHLTVFCTNTLELGIDIGDIDEVGLIDPPHSVASFIQRIGRSGRKSDSKIEFRFILKAEPLGPDSTDYEELRLPFIQSIALVELMLEKWCEPGRSQTQSYSTFVHQYMSYIAQRRICTQDDVWNIIAQGGFSNRVSQQEFTEITDHLLERDYLMRDQRGMIFLGSQGDLLTQSRDFYSVFHTPQEWSIRTKSKKIGKIPLTNMFHEGSTILFSGQMWLVIQVDFSSSVLLVEPSHQGAPPIFTGSGLDIHKEIHQKMKSIYEGTSNYPYLQGDGVTCLKEARSSYTRIVNSRSFLPLFMGSGLTKFAVFYLESLEQEVEDMSIGVNLKKLDPKTAIEKLKQVKRIEDLERCLRNKPIEKLRLEKYDHLLPKSVLKKSFLKQTFDTDNLFDYLKQLKVDDNQAVSH